MAYFIPAVAGLTVLTGLNGQISLGHGALMAVGAYTTAVLLDERDGPPFLLVVLLVASLVDGRWSAPSSASPRPGCTVPTSPVRRWPSPSGCPGSRSTSRSPSAGSRGCRCARREPSERLETSSRTRSASTLRAQKYIAYVGWALTLIVLFLLSNLIVSRYGRSWRAVRDDEVAAELAGINLGRARVLGLHGQRGLRPASPAR